MMIISLKKKMLSLAYFADILRRHTPKCVYTSTVHLCYVYIASSEETRVNMQLKCGIESFFQYYYVSLSVMIILMYMYRARLDKYQQFLN